MEQKQNTMNLGNFRVHNPLEGIEIQSQFFFVFGKIYSLCKNNSILHIFFFNSVFNILMAFLLRSFNMITDTD